MLSFYTSRDLRNFSGEMWNQLTEGEVVITNNGKPKALVLNIEEQNFDELLKAVRQAKAQMAFSRMRETAARGGYLSDEEIEAEIAASRKEKKGD